jgi:hypothetical protein
VTTPRRRNGAFRLARLRASRLARLRAFLGGLVLLGAVGSCELPKPPLPSLGMVPGGPSVVIGT